MSAITLAVLLVLSIAGVATASAFVQSWLAELPDYNSPNAFKVAEATRIYSADRKLLAKFYLENRTVVPIEKMSPHLVDAIVAVEDERFYEHNGVDPEGIARAAFTWIGGTRQGASTITQQYIRNTILLGERTDITPARKVREAYLAVQLEKRFTKRQILEMYLNTIYFGEGAYGAEAASRTYFSKPASKLSLAQAATLAGVVQRPSSLSPIDNPKGAQRRRNMVLARMLANGFITRAQYKKAIKSTLKVRRGWEPDQGIRQAPYFVAHVRKQLLQKYPQSVVFKGGLKVYTTLDTRVQKKAEAAVRHKLDAKGDPAAALVAIDPRTGHIKAMVGGRDYQKNKFNLASQGRRQPGSAFKTFALAAAMSAGVPPWQDIDSSSPATIPSKYKPWVVSNSEGSGHGMMSLENATAHSVNTVYARLTKAIGVRRVAKTAKKMGISSKLPNYPSITLGTRNVSPLEMASAYGTLATGGTHYKHMSITKIVGPDGDVMYRQKPHGDRALRPDVARAVTDVLMGVIDYGTGTRADIGRPAAGKTGTSQNYRDAWFVGYTPQLVTAVWVGYPSERPMYSVNGIRGFGGTLAAPIWHDFMIQALAGKPVLQFKRAGEPEWHADRFDFPVSKQARDWERRKKQQEQQGSTPSGGGSSGGGSGGGSSGGGGSGGGSGGGGSGGGSGGGGSGGGGSGNTSGTAN
ncbi:MAG: PBP1A family penicillin-binding protein [Coriobacteriales bacterium]|nr:PBP1A family penicillin-binding protein [Coriobacteriales bacterium]